MIPPKASSKIAYEPTALEVAVVDELNKARTDPAGYAKTLRGPGAAEAMAFLQAQKPVPALSFDPRLGAAANEQWGWLNSSGQLVHTGADGATILTRVQRQGMYPMVAAEEIATGQKEAQGVIAQLIIDASSPNRAHRADLFAIRFERVGVRCGAHPKTGSACVIDLSGKPMEREPPPPP